MNLEIFIDDWLNSWTGNEPDKLISFYHKDVFYSDPANPNGILDIKFLYSYFKKLLSKNPNWVWRRIDLYKSNEFIFLKWVSQIPTNKEIIELKGLDLIQIKDELIIKNEVYFDTYKWRSILT